MFCRVLQDDQVVRIHETSIAILDRVGVEVPHEKILSRFADAGAAVDFSAQRVRVPPAMVERSIAEAGKALTLAGRGRGPVAAVGSGGGHRGRSDADRSQRGRAAGVVGELAAQRRCRVGACTRATRRGNTSRQHVATACSTRGCKHPPYGCL